MITLDSPVTTVLGDKATKRKRMAEGLGIETVGDLLRHFPRRYVKTGELTQVSALREGEMLTLVGEIGHGAQNIYSEALGDSGVPGPNRFVRMMSAVRWDTTSELRTSLESKLKGAVPATLAVMTAEFSGPTMEAVSGSTSSYLLESIAWSASLLSLPARLKNTAATRRSSRPLRSIAATVLVKLGVAASPAIASISPLCASSARSKAGR